MRQENSPSSQYTIVIQLILLVFTLEHLNSSYDPVTLFVIPPQARAADITMYGYVYQ